MWFGDVAIASSVGDSLGMISAGRIAYSTVSFMNNNNQVNVRYMVTDVTNSADFYVKHLGFTIGRNAAPAFIDVTRGNLRLLLSSDKSSAGRPMPDGAQPVPGGWNRFELIVEDLENEVNRLKGEGVKFRNDIVKGPGGSQILLIDPSGNFVELFQPIG